MKLKKLLLLIKIFESFVILKKSTILKIVSILVSLCLVFYLFQDVELGALVAEMDKIRLEFLAIFLFNIYLVFVIRAYRWKLLIPNSNNEPKITFSNLFDSTMIGFFASFVLPLRAGEFIRPLTLSKWSGLSFGSLFASIVVERVLDILALLVFFGYLLVNLNNVPEIVNQAAYGLGALACFILTFIVICYVAPSFLKSLTEKIFSVIFFGPFQKFKKSFLELSSDFIDGMQAVKSFSQLIQIIFSSLIIWFLMSVFYASGISAFSEPSSLLKGISVNVLVALSVSIPSAPGFIGTFQLGCSLALEKLYSFSHEFTLAYSLLVHLFQIAFVILFAVYIFYKRNISMKESLSE